MTNRRHFLQKVMAGAIGLGIGGQAAACQTLAKTSNPSKKGKMPGVISTWNFGKTANQAAWKVLSNKGSALDAVEQGVRVIESDEENLTVGKGGLPDRDGNVTLDACIMDEKGNAGSVCFLQHIEHPISVARAVMEKTPHVMLAGDGALQFALSQGFKKTNLLTEKGKEQWEEWKKTSQYKPVINIERHDTIGMIAIDGLGKLAGACTTSGLSYKMYGRVGDSPIIGAGLFVDGGVGAAVATGMGELVMRTLGSFLTVELMRQGASPQEAVEEAVMRIVKSNSNYRDVQVGYIAVDNKGTVGSYAIQPGFQYAYHTGEGSQLYDVKSFI